MIEAGHQLPDTINPTFFPAKLWRMVNNPANTAIYWDTFGEVVVVDQHLIERLVLSPGYTNNERCGDTFKTTDFSSFVRQLNLYGFRKVKLSSCTINLASGIISPESKGAIHRFHNPYFRRYNPALLVNLKRRVGNTAKSHSIIEMKCRPASQCHNYGCRGDNGLEKPLMKGGSSSVGGGHKDSPHPYSKLSKAPQSTPIHPRHLTPVGHPYASGLSNTLHQGVRFEANYYTPIYAGIDTQNEQYQTGFYHPALQFYPTTQMAVPYGMQTRFFMPMDYFQASNPMTLGREGQSPDSQNNNKQGFKKADTNLDNVYQTADEVMLTQSNKNLMNTVVSGKALASDDHIEVCDPVQTPKEALNEETKEVKTEVRKVVVVIPVAANTYSFRNTADDLLKDVR